MFIHRGPLALVVQPGCVPNDAHQGDPYACPLEQDTATGLASAFSAVAQWDPLFDHVRAYARFLQEHGVPAELHIGLGLVDASLRASGCGAVERVYDAMARALTAILDQSPARLRPCSPLARIAV
ncbi:hypothetical protein cym2001_41140 [Pseudomonas sp. CYM-20-01]|nr:hypothetical protein cym2001_41140 [Pseudomonas sp. CYM-20-01]